MPPPFVIRPSYRPVFQSSRYVSGAGGSPSDAALKRIQSLPGYLATFDYRESATVRTTGDVEATTGDRVERWNSIDNALAYFTATGALRPELNADGVGNDAAGQRMDGTGIGDVTGRTVVVFFERQDESGLVNVLGGDGFNRYTLINSSGTSVFTGASLNVSGPSTGSGFQKMAAVRKSVSDNSIITGADRETIDSAVNDGTRPGTGMVLLAANASATSPAEVCRIRGFCVIESALSDSDFRQLVDDATIYFAKTTATINVFDMWGQSNASGRGDTTGITDFDSVDPTRAFMANTDNISISGFDFGVNQNVGGDSTSSQFGAESELLRLDTLTGSNHSLVVKYALSATSLDVNWRPSGTLGFQYTEAMAKSATIRSCLATQGYKVNSKGLLWMQGERDAAISTASGYSALLQTLVANYRAEFGSSLPVSVMRIKITTGGYPETAEVQAAQADAVASMSNASLIDTTSDVTYPQDDGLHFNATGQIAIGSAAFSQLP